MLPHGIRGLSPPWLYLPSTDAAITTAQQIDGLTHYNSHQHHHSAYTINRIYSSTELRTEIGLQRAFRANELYISSILQHLLLLLQLEVVLLINVRESPLLRDNDLLPSGELVTSTAESLHDDRGILLLATDREDDLTNVHTGNGTVRLAPGTTHTSLQPISTGAGQHLVDTDDMEGVHTHAQMERILAARLGHILVGANTGSFKSLT